MKSILLSSLLFVVTFTAFSQIRMVHVNPTADTVVIRNFGDTTINIGTYRFCSLFSYGSISSFTASGSLDLSLGDEVTISGFSLNDAGADLGLYLPAGGFGDAISMLDFIQWGSAGNGRESVANTKGIWNTGEFLTGDVPYSYTGDGVETGFSFWGTPASPKLRLIYVDADVDSIVIKNFGAQVDITDYQLCAQFSYDQISNLSASGSLDLNMGSEVSIMGFALTDAGTDLGLYLPGGSFGDSAAMVDFVQWGSAGNGRESVADDKGIWSTGDFIDGFSPYEYTGDGDQIGLAFWNALGQDTATTLPPTPTAPLVKFIKVDPVNDTIVIKNFGTLQDISSYQLCSEFAYAALSSLTASGSLSLDINDEVTITGFSIDETDADLGLYSSGSFTDTAAMVDFMQWGGSGIGRESVAVSKGIWISGDHIVGNPPYTYSGDGSESGLSTWQTITGVVTVDSGEEIAIYPNPAEDYVSISFKTQKVKSIVIFDLIGNEIMAIDASQSADLKLGQLFGGIYFVKAFDNQGNFIAGERLIIK